MSKRTLVLGDVHGAYRALTQVLERAGFDPASDRLIQIGDIADGWTETVECVELLMNVPDKILIRGNHDTWAYEWIRFGQTNPYWPEYGGAATIRNYQRHRLLDIPQHIAFFESQQLYFVDEAQRLFVHAGYTPSRPIAELDEFLLAMDRTYWRLLLEHEKNGTPLPKDVNGFTEVFFGHTQTTASHPDGLPVHIAHAWNVDTGCKSFGALTLMDVSTKEYWQSDPVFLLYPEVDI